MAEPPAWLQAARSHWRWHGLARPPFAATPGPGQTSVWDFPRPPRRPVRVLETAHPPSYYLPWDDVARHLLEPAGGGSFCEWKGPAHYWTLVSPGASRAARAGRAFR